MANMDIDSGKWVLEYEIAAAGEKTITLNTADSFVDKNIEIDISTPEAVLAAGSASMEASSDTGLLGTASSTQPATGHYIKLEGDAEVDVTSGGWVDEGDSQAASIADVYYPIQDATFVVDGASVKTVASTGEGYVAAGETVGTIPNGSQTISGGGLSETASSSAITSDGAYNGTSYDTSDKVKFESAEAAGVYKIHSDGSATVARAAVEKQVTSAGYFAADGSAQTAIAGDSITVTNPDHAYYIKKSTLSASSVTPSTSAQTVTVGEGYAPADRTITIAAMDAGAASSSLANTGLSTYFNAGTSADHDVALTPQHSIDTAGYLAQTANPVDGTPAYYSIKEQTVTETTTTVSGTTATRGTRSESAGWKDTAETLSIASFANSATSGETYVDISGTTSAPVLVSGDYLYINEGWTDNVKISLAKLVPDGSDVKGHDEYILTGHSAYDDDGTLVAGSMPVYDGSYTIA